MGRRERRERRERRSGRRIIEEIQYRERIEGRTLMLNREIGNRMAGIERSVEQVTQNREYVSRPLVMVEPMAQPITYQHRYDESTYEYLRLLSQNMRISMQNHEYYSDIIGNNIRNNIYTEPFGEDYEFEIYNHGISDIEKFSKIEKIDADKTCTICYDDFKKGAEFRKMNCDHEFCVKCADKWFNKCVRCPLCNHDFETNRNDPYNYQNNDNNDNNDDHIMEEVF